MIGRKRRKKENRDSKREEPRYYGTGYWTNEPGFIPARRAAYPNEPQQDREGSYGYGTNEAIRRREEDLNQSFPEWRGYPYGDTDNFVEGEFYDNRGWARSAAEERDRDWGYTSRQNYTRSHPLQIDYSQDEYWQRWGDEPWHPDKSFARGQDDFRERDAAESKGQEGQWVERDIEQDEARDSKYLNKDS